MRKVEANVVRKDRSQFAPGKQAAVDQSAAAFQSGFLFHQSTHFGSAPPHRLRECAVPEPLGVLEPGHGDNDDRR